MCFSIIDVTRASACQRANRRTLAATRQCPDGGATGPAATDDCGGMAELPASYDYPGRCLVRLAATFTNLPEVQRPLAGFASE